MSFTASWIKMRFLLALALTACHAPVVSNPLVTAHSTIASLDRAYISWYQNKASNAKTREELDYLVKIEQTWEQWFGRVARLIALAESSNDLDERKAAEIAIENEIEQARRWLVALGVFIKKQGALKQEQRLSSSDLQSAARAFDDVCPL